MTDVYLKNTPGGVRRKTRKHKAQCGGGEWWRFLIEKPGEIPDQLKLFYRSFRKGHGLTTLASIGNWIHKHGKAPAALMVPLNRIMLWHPVRGESERENAGAKTTMRKESMISYFRTVNTEKPMLLSESVFATIPGMASADAVSAIMVTPLPNDVRRFMKESMAKARPTREAIGELLRRIDETKGALKARSLMPDASRTTLKRLSSLHYYEPLNPDVPRLEGFAPFYIVSSGQGRLQAIKEAIMEVGIDPEFVMIELQVYDVPRNLCSLFLITGNEYRKDGYFADPRHILDNKMFPSVESCYKMGTTPEDTLSLYRELDREDSKEVFNAETFSEGEYESGESAATGKVRRKTRRSNR